MGGLLLAEADHPSLCLVVDADDQLLTERQVFGLLFHQLYKWRLRLEDLGEVHSLEVRTLLRLRNLHPLVGILSQHLKQQQPQVLILDQGQVGISGLDVFDDGVGVDPRKWVLMRDYIVDQHS